ncbi:DUF973 family protein [Sulfuracidifex metallicus]|nr:DUF973 family protein [Sulfuracidifex metallicus]
MAQGNLENMKSLIKQNRKNKSGLSGAVTALILVIASVLIALIVVAFAFGFLGFTNTATVTQVGPAYIEPVSSGTGSSSSTSYKLVVTLSASAPVTITEISGTGISGNYGVTTALSAGTNPVTIYLPSTFNAANSAYTFTLTLSNGNTAVVNAVLQ